MRTHVALLRGLNVGGHNRIAMSDLRDLATSIGLVDVVTYIQSGNLVFTSPETDQTALAAALEKRIARQLEVRPAVIVLSREEFAGVVADNPYPNEPNPKCLHVVFHRSDPGPDAAASLAAAERRARGMGSRDEGVVIGRHVFLHTPDGLGRSELALELNRHRTAPTTVSTMRNWATVTRLMALVNGDPPSQRADGAGTELT